MALIIFVSVQIFGWLAVSNEPTLDGFYLDVMPESAVYMEVIVPDEEEEQEALIQRLSLPPGYYALVEIRMANPEETDVLRKVYLQSVSVHYPTQKQVLGVGYTFPEKYVNNGCYYVGSTTTKFDEMTIPTNEKQAFFETFMAPASNCIQYEIYVEGRTRFHEGYAPKYISALSNATQEQLHAAPGLFNPLITDMQLLPTTDAVNNGLVTTAGEVLIPAGSALDDEEPFTLYMLLYFNPNMSSVGTYNSQAITMKNSNAYMLQEVKLTFDCKDTPAP